MKAPLVRHASRAIPFWKWKLLIVAYQRACRYHYRATRLYQALADREPDASRQSLLRLLRREASRQARAYAGGLTLLHTPAPGDEDTLLDRAWRGLLVRCGLKIALTWLDWDEKSLAVLFEVLATIPQR